MKKEPMNFKALIMLISMIKYGDYDAFETMLSEAEYSYSNKKINIDEYHAIGRILYVYSRIA